MTALSILRAVAASAANPLKTDTGQEQSRPAPESGFKGLFEDAIQGWVNGETKDAKQVIASDDDAPEPPAGDEDHSQPPILVTVMAAILPAPPPASFGLPSEGVEPGEGMANQAEPIANGELIAAAAGNKTVTTATQPDPQADLAFALRLASPATKKVEVENARPALASAQSDPATPAKYQQVEPTPVEPPRRGPSVQPDRETTSAPAIARIAPPDRTAAESGPKQSNDGFSKREQPAQSPRPAGIAQPEVELKPLHEPAATPAPPEGAHREIPLPMPGPPTTVAVSASIVSVPEARVSAGPTSAAPAAAAPAAVRTNPTAEVTDVSVTLLAPRADSTGEDRVAIRMVRKGAEIHVSVRTPDNQLSQTLRQDLGRLATGLDAAGFRTETWRPVITGVAAASQPSASPESSQEGPNRDNPGPDARSGGHSGQNPGEQKRRQQDERPRWVVELEQYKNL